LRSGDPPLIDQDLDTGKPTAPGEYELADRTYAELLDKLAEHNFVLLPQDLKTNILNFYSRSAGGLPEKKGGKRWKKTQAELSLLKAAPSGTSLQ
jgi:hypothetical protein